MKNFCFHCTVDRSGDANRSTMQLVSSPNVSSPRSSLLPMACSKRTHPNVLARPQSRIADATVQSPPVFDDSVLEARLVGANDMHVMSDCLLSLSTLLYPPRRGCHKIEQLKSRGLRAGSLSNEQHDLITKRKYGPDRKPWALDSVDWASNEPDHVHFHGEHGASNNRSDRRVSCRQSRAQVRSLRSRHGSMHWTCSPSVRKHAGRPLSRKKLRALCGEARNLYDTWRGATRCYWSQLPNGR